MAVNRKRAAAHTAALLLYLCKNVIDGFNAQTAFNDRSKSKLSAEIREPLFMEALQAYQLFKTILTSNIADTSNNTAESTLEISGLRGEESQLDQELAGDITSANHD